MEVINKDRHFMHGTDIIQNFLTLSTLEGSVVCWLKMGETSELGWLSGSSTRDMWLDWCVISRLSSVTIASTSRVRASDILWLQMTVNFTTQRQRGYPRSLVSISVRMENEDKILKSSWSIVSISFLEHPKFKSGPRTGYFTTCLRLNSELPVTWWESTPKLTSAPQHCHPSGLSLLSSSK
jgi:hypothetical protein